MRYRTLGRTGLRVSEIGFGGAQLLFQPFLNRFAFGLEVDAVGVRSGLGFAVLPSLRCAL